MCGNVAELLPSFGFFFVGTTVSVVFVVVKLLFGSFCHVVLVDLGSRFLHPDTWKDVTKLQRLWRLQHMWDGAPPRGRRSTANCTFSRCLISIVMSQKRRNRNNQQSKHAGLEKMSSARRPVTSLTTNQETAERLVR